MLEYENFVYLDVQKTGSTFIRLFLREFAATDEIAGNKHRTVDKRIGGKLYIISCRNPLQQYRSLYTFGCLGKGKMRTRLENKGMLHLYDGSPTGFSGWLELVLTPSTSRKYLSGFDNHELLDVVGVQTLRFLRLALPSYRGAFDELKSKEDVLNAFQHDGLCDVLLKTESLNSDLLNLATGPHAALFKNTASAESYLTDRPKKNVSTEKFDIDLTALSPEILLLAQQREWFFFEALGYSPLV
jgi:hypothetical protein